MARDEDMKLVDKNAASASQKVPEPWENSNHPLFLHHSDQPGAVLVSQPLMEDNYTTWVQSMSMALTIKNKKGFVDGTLNKPADNPNEQRQWDRCNTLVKTWLLGAMSKEISGSVIHCKDARGMWLELQERFSHTNTVQLFHIENAIHDCEQGTNSVTSYFTKLKGLWDEKDALCAFPPCSCDTATEVKTYMETQKTMKFLMGLSDNYATIRSNVIGMDPLPSVNKAYAMALRHEKQADRRKAAMEGGQARPRGNHVASSNDDKETMNTFPFSQEECQQLLGLLNKNKPALINQVGNVPNYEELSGKAFSLSQNGKETIWILDSGATY
ncbi:uncharacterized protein LOC133714607 [Rosa rugosa]|uniref:uncharacterized protein LOC133714607 n=1 Tax=Rosa rugosa TaxID=74645 RepID=UPI002B417F74|nr:uncharacterized protein LOC133714607 [Rosa rugosa]